MVVNSISFKHTGYKICFNNVGADWEVNVSEPHNSADYIIFKVDGTTIAKNGWNGKIEFLGPDSGAVIQSAVNALDNGGTILLKPRIYENVSVLLKDNVRILGDFSSKVAYPLVKVIGNGTDPVFYTPDSTISSQSEMTHNLGLQNLIIDGKGADKVLRFPNLDTLFMSSVRVTNGNWGLYVEPNIDTTDPALFPGGLFLRNNVFSTTRGIYGKYLTQCWISENWFENPDALNWITLVSPTKVRFNLNEFNNIAKTTADSAVNLSDDSNVALSDVIFRDNYYSITASGVKVFKFNFTNSNSKRLIVHDHVSSASGGWDYPNLPCSEFQITGYNTRSTHAKGIATISSGNTSVTVNHGLYVPAPSRLHIQVTPLSDPGSYYYVTNLTYTSFDIALGSSAGSDITFAWEAYVE